MNHDSSNTPEANNPQVDPSAWERPSRPDPLPATALLCGIELALFEAERRTRDAGERLIASADTYEQFVGERLCRDAESLRALLFGVRESRRAADVRAREVTR